MTKSRIIYRRLDELHPYENNPRKNEGAIQYVANSIREFGFRNPIITDTHGVIIAGHTRYEASKLLHLKEVPVIVVDDLTDDQIKALRLADNKTAEFAEWDAELLNIELGDIDLDMTDFGFNVNVDFGNLEGMMSQEHSEEYDQFLDKFKEKHTTDDCFTPEAVYDAVREWVADNYHHKGKIVRPFYPGGDYQKEYYPKGCLVLDNPPFSIMAEIVKWYLAHGIDFFLFANHLTCMNNVYDGVNVVLTNINIVYDNGADINTSFLTNLGEDRIRCAGSLYAKLEEAQPNYTKSLKAYEHPDNVITASSVGRLAKYGSDFTIKHIQTFRRFDSGEEVFGNGAWISDADAEKVKAEKVKAEKVKAEKVKIKIPVSEKERSIIDRLNAMRD